jgi:hypothetical protein
MIKYHKQVCVKIATDAQYDSIKPILKKFITDNISFDIYIPKYIEDTSGINYMFEKTYNIIKSDGFNNIERKVNENKKYHLALITPNYEEGIKAKYYIKYSYGPSHTVKPSSTHIPQRLNRYHGYILHSQRDLDIFSVFSKTYLLPDLKYIGYKHTKKANTDKQTLLFLPSWEDQSNLDWIMSAATQLKNNYNIIVKLHPYGDFGAPIPEEVKFIKEKIRKISNEFYDGDASLKELLERCDLVISGISGAVLDSMYAEIPVVIYSDDIYKYDLLGIKSACSLYVDEGYISISKSANELVNEVPKALSKHYIQKQQQLSKNIFRKDYTTSAIDGWMDVINSYLYDKVNQEYVAMHNIMSNDYWHYKNEVEHLKNELQERDNELLALTTELNSFYSIRRSIRLFAGNIKLKIKG